MSEWRRTVNLLLISLALARAGDVSAAGNEIALRPLPTNGVWLGDGLGLFHAGSAQWSLEGGVSRNYLAGLWAGPADFDGDGHPEWVLSAPAFRRGKEDAGKVWVVSPDLAKRSLTVRWSWLDADTRRHAGEALAAGDFNRDGFTDLVVGIPGVRGIGEVAVFGGSRTNLSSAPVWAMKAAAKGSRLGASLATGDVNRDGFADLVVSEPGWSDETGRVFLFTGSSGGLSLAAHPSWTLHGMAPGERLGANVALLDANGDGQLDLAVSAPGLPVRGGTNTGRVRLHPGSNGVFASAPAWEATGAGWGEGFGQVLCAPGDLNRDGFDELAVSWTGSGQQGSGGPVGEVCLYYGQTNGLATTPRWRKSGTVPGARYGASIAGVGDVNGDGWRDVVIGCHGDTFLPVPVFIGRAELFLGSATGLAGEPSWSVGNLRPHGNTGKYATAVGDINGDGLADFALSSPSFDSAASPGGAEGRIDIFLGQRRGYAAGEVFPTDGTNALPFAVALAEFNAPHEAVARRDVAARWTRRLVWLVAGLGGALLGLSLLGRWQRLRAATAAARLERERIARDLHDGLGSGVHRVQRLTELLNQVEENSPLAQQHRDELIQSARALSGLMDRAIWSVQPEQDTLENLVTFLADYAPSVLRPQGIACELDLPAALPVLPLRGDTRQHLFLAVNEALHNVVKHSRAGRAWLRVAWAEPWLEIVVEDDGCGFAASSLRKGGGNGSGNLKTRMEELRGGCVVEARDGGGTRLTLRMPMPLQMAESRL